MKWKVIVCILWVYVDELMEYYKNVCVVNVVGSFVLIVGFVVVVIGFGFFFVMFGVFFVLVLYGVGVVVGVVGGLVNLGFLLMEGYF